LEECRDGLSARFGLEFSGTDAPSDKVAVDGQPTLKRVKGTEKVGFKGRAKKVPVFMEDFMAERVKDGDVPLGLEEGGLMAGCFVGTMAGLVAAVPDLVGLIG
jgi:hypothetical protein